MKQIRSNVFETNSSSSHSLVITTVDEHYTREEINNDYPHYRTKDGKIRIWSNYLEFYRSPFEMLATFESKVRYAIAASGGKLVNEIEDICSKYIDNFNGFAFDTKTKYKKVIVNGEEDWEEDGEYPDYGGTDDYQIEGWLKDYNVSLEEFLTNRRYIVIVDGDEYCIWDEIKNSGLCTTDKIVHDSYREWQDKLREKYEKTNLED